MINSNNHSRLFKLACRILKYFLLFLAGFTLVCLLTTVLGAFQLALILISSLGHVLLRLSVLVLAFLAVAIVFESMRF